MKLKKISVLETHEIAVAKSWVKLLEEEQHRPCYQFMLIRLPLLLEVVHDLLRGAVYVLPIRHRNLCLSGLIGSLIIHLEVDNKVPVLRSVPVYGLIIVVMAGNVWPYTLLIRPSGLSADAVFLQFIKRNDAFYSGIVRCTFLEQNTLLIGGRLFLAQLNGHLKLRRVQEEFACHQRRSQGESPERCGPQDQGPGLGWGSAR
jgi:hypothetical protein